MPVRKVGPNSYQWGNPGKYIQEKVLKPKPSVKVVLFTLQDTKEPKKINLLKPLKRKKKNH